MQFEFQINNTFLVEVYSIQSLGHTMLKNYWLFIWNSNWTVCPIFLLVTQDRGDFVLHFPTDVCLWRGSAPLLPNWKTKRNSSFLSMNFGNYQTWQEYRGITICIASWQNCKLEWSICKQSVEMIGELANVHTPNFDHRGIHHHVTQNNKKPGGKACCIIWNTPQNFLARSKESDEGY